MGDKYSTIQQHQPLRVPSNWGPQEKRLIAQLEEIFDDLYSRFNRLKMSDLGKPLQEAIKSSADGVTELRTELTQTEAEVALKASRSEVNALGDRVTTAETAITAKADAIDLTALRTQVDNQEIGGRNLFLDSERARSTTRFLSIDVHDILADHVGESVCVSFEIMGSVARECIVYPYQERGVSISERHTFTMPTSEYQRVSFVSTVKDWGLEVTGTTLGSVGIYDVAGDNSYTVRKIKVELGNMPTDWTPSPEEMENASLRIDASGLKMKGGIMDFQAGSEFKVRSGGVFNVYAKSDASAIRFGGTDADHPNFSLGAGGQVIAKKVFTDELEITGGGLLLTLLSGSLANQLIASDTQPQGHGILWIDTSGGGGSGTLDFTLAHSNGEDMTPADNTVTLSGFTPGSGSVTGNCTYGVQFRIYNYSGTCSYYKVTVTLSDGTNSVQVLDETVNQWVYPGDYFDVNTLNNPSSAMTNITGGNLSMTVRLRKYDSNHDPVSTGARFEVNQPFTIRAVGSAGQGTAQACTVKYIP